MPNYEILLEQRLTLRKNVTINADTALEALRKVNREHAEGTITLSLEDKVECGNQVKLYALSADEKAILTTKEEEELEEKLLEGRMSLDAGEALYNRLMKNKEAMKTVIEELNAMEEMTHSNGIYCDIANTALSTGLTVLLYDEIPAEAYIRLSDFKLFIKTEHPYVIEEEIGYLGGKTKKVCKDNVPRMFVEYWDKVKHKLEATLAEIVRDKKQLSDTPEARVYLVAGGGCRHLFHEGSKAECLALCETYDWEYIDENQFEWRMELDELE